MLRRAVLDATVRGRLILRENHFKGCVARQDADCDDGNKDNRIAATLLIPPQNAKPNQTVKSCCKTALIWLCDI